jgi:hypothetical protein
MGLPFTCCELIYTFKQFLKIHSSMRLACSLWGLRTQVLMIQRPAFPSLYSTCFHPILHFLHLTSYGHAYSVDGRYFYPDAITAHTTVCWSWPENERGAITAWWSLSFGDSKSSEFGITLSTFIYTLPSQELWWQSLLLPILFLLQEASLTPPIFTRPLPQWLNSGLTPAIYQFVSRNFLSQA